MKQSLRVLVIFGTRPEAVKMAPVIKELKKHPDRIETRVCVTAQHREMLDQVLQAFDITPDIDLNLMQPNQNLAQLTARIFTELDPVLKAERPDWHFAPTENNRRNLLREGIPDEIIRVTGNTAIDALHLIIQQPTPQEAVHILKQAGVSPGDRRLVLVTAHRRENFGQPILDICKALKQLADQYRDEITLVYPVHLNPNIQEPVYNELSEVDNIILLPPLDYLPLIHLMKHATLILTDSGGIQEEAPSLGIPTLVLRERTERQEGVTAGTLKLVGTEPEAIVTAAQELLDVPEAYAAMSGAVNPYGDGHAAERIVSALLEGDTDS
jgi:UDP-N-acetylglucosamine 2-epimerase (non-hydrolysing)